MRSGSEVVASARTREQGIKAGRRRVGARDVTRPMECTRTSRRAKRRSNLCVNRSVSDRFGSHHSSSVATANPRRNTKARSAALTIAAGTLSPQTDLGVQGAEQYVTVDNTNPGSTMWGESSIGLLLGSPVYCSLSLSLSAAAAAPSCSCLNRLRGDRTLPFVLFHRPACSSHNATQVVWSI